ncbi:hypothetical protein JOE64_002582 [Microbacterium dextranolyticum]|nr:hypothetical protein [Microbacterium dextranolyticum]
MPKKIDPALRERAVRLVLEHRSEYPSNAKVIAAVARQECVGAESFVDDEHVLAAHRVADVEDAAAGFDRSVRVNGRDADPVEYPAVR